MHVLCVCTSARVSHDQCWTLVSRAAQLSLYREDHVRSHQQRLSGMRGKSGIRLKFIFLMTRAVHTGGAGRVNSRWPG